LSHQHPYVPNQLQRLQQSQAARHQQIQTMVDIHLLKNPGGVSMLAHGLAQQHMSQHTAAAQAQMSQQIQSQLMSAYHNQSSIGGLGSGGGYHIHSTNLIPISTSTTVPMGSVFLTTGSSAATSYYSQGTAGQGQYVTVHPSQMQAVQNAVARSMFDELVWTVPDGTEREIRLPDGTVILVNKDGSYVINDKDAKVTYRANRVRDFNRFLNVSDRLEEFIAFCGKEGVRRGDMLELPIKLFIGWLALEAAKADREEPPDVELLGPLRRIRTPRCRGCGQHLPVSLLAGKIDFCSPPCFEDHFRRLTAPPPMLLLPPPKERVAA
jgi:hypothetical protein